MKISSLVVLVVLAGGGCDLLQPKLNVEVKAVAACNQTGLMSGVGFMQVRAVNQAGDTSTVNGRVSKGSADLAGLAIEDGTTVFMQAYPGESADALNGFAGVAGATVPLDLKKHVTEERLPPTNRRYDSVSLLLGKVNEFGRTTNAADGSCTELVQGRHGHTATFSSSAGKVVIIGGLNHTTSGEGFVPRARAVELFDPSTGTFEAVNLGANGPLMERAFHTATELPDGNILVVGGVGPEGDGTLVSPRAVSFIFNPTTLNAITLGVPQGFQIKRYHHQATLTANSVVITGGCACRGSLTADQLKAGMCPPVTETCSDATGLQGRVGAVDVFDVATQRFTTVVTGLLQKPRAFHTASLLAGGLLVVAGGDDGVSPISQVELLRVVPNVSFITASNDTLDASAVTHAASVVLSSEDCSLLLPDHPQDNRQQCVLITGGCRSLVTNGTCGQVQSTASILDYGRASGSRLKAGPSHHRPRWGHHAVYLPSGQNMVLAAGGKFEVQGTEPARSAEVLPRQTGVGGLTPFAPVLPPFMFGAAHRGAVTVLPSGQVLFTGGVLATDPNPTASLGSAEFYFHQLY